MNDEENLKLKYLRYIQEVLGITHVFQNSFSEILSEVDKRFFFSNQNYDKEKQKFAFINLISDQKESLFDPKTNELYEKIRASIQLDGTSSYAMDSLHLSVDETIEHLRSQKYSFEKVLFFVSDDRYNSTQGIQNNIDFKWAISPSPYLMLQDEQLKKIAWLILKQF